MHFLKQGFHSQCSRFRFFQYVSFLDVFFRYHDPYFFCQCSCLRYQDRTLSMDIRLGALKLYRQHLVAQYADRCAYWALKDISSDVMAQTITITTDGADQVPWFFFFCGEGRETV